nr:cyclic lactone autoinducer peptide [Sedimentibacter sp.]
MKNIKKTVLSFVARQIKNTAISAAGTTSYWGAYQPKEPKCLSFGK